MVSTAPPVAIAAADRTPRRRATWGVAAASACAGLLIAASVPPMGFWPLGIVGLAVLVGLLRDRPLRTRALIGFLGGLGLYAVTISWFAEFNAIGAVASMAVEAAFLAAAGAATPPGRGRRAGFVGAVVLQDWLRTYIPFGGVPLGGVPLGQAAGPLVPAARIGGQLALTGVAATAAVALELVAAAAARRARLTAGGTARGPGRRAAREDGREEDRRAAGEVGDEQDRRAAGEVGDEQDRRAAGELGDEPDRPAPRGAAAGSWARGLAAACAVVVALPLAGALVPAGRTVGTMRVALVQGGGPRGLRAVETSSQRVFDAQVAATARVRGPVDLIVWPEDVIALPGPLAGSPQEAQVGAIARAQGTPLLAGVTEDVGSDKFRNAMVEWSPAGVVTGRYDKVHRVPFGEYVPLRSLVARIVSLDAIPRDAIPGHGSGALATPAGRVAITISYEVFFPDRARSAVRDGGQVLLVPTNTASYTTTQVSAAEVAAMRVRAWSTGRDVAMVAPTGWSAVVDSRGRVRQRSPLQAPAVLEATLARRTGETPWVRWGDLPVLVASALLVGSGWALARRN